MSLILIRHGQSVSNQKNLFTGWYDAPLTSLGKEQAIEAGKILKEHHVHLDTVHTSLLTRTIQTTYLILETIDKLYLPIHKTWRLNGRHYGALEGMNKDQARKIYGEDQVKQWRRSYRAVPPLADTHSLCQRYPFLPPEVIPRGESLEQTRRRMEPYIEEVIQPELLQGRDVLVVAHGNVLRAFTMILENLSEEEVFKVEIQNAQPIVYDFHSDLSVAKKIIWTRSSY